jgi:hypothetical protein
VAGLLLIIIIVVVAVVVVMCFRRRKRSGMRLDAPSALHTDNDDTHNVGHYYTSARLCVFFTYIYLFCLMCGHAFGLPLPTFRDSGELRNPARRSGPRVVRSTGVDGCPTRAGGIARLQRRATPYRLGSVESAGSIHAGR